ncbi:MAG: 4Fe-4S binding protein [Pirellulaceae bacterium]
MHRSKQLGLAAALTILAGTLLWSVYANQPLNGLSLQAGPVVALAAVLLWSAVLLGLTSFERNSPKAWIRLDWFVPTLRKTKENTPLSRSMGGRILRRLIPKRFQSNHATKQRGLLRRNLRRLGLSWVASPVRRFTQAVCWLAFMLLFLYVCWPYDAAPQAGTVSKGWIFRSLDQETGEVLITQSDKAAEHLTSNAFAVRDIIFITRSAENPSVPAQLLGSLRVDRAEQSELYLSPVGDLSEDLLDAILGGVPAHQSFDFHQRDPNAWPSHYADNLARKEVIPAETFLIIDPLVSLSTAIAARSWVWSLASAAIILIVCILIPRGFCGYLCPLGTTIDFFDWAIAGRTKRFRVPDDGWWVHTKYYLLAGTLVAAVCGVLVSGFFSAIPVITRGMLFLVDPLQSGTLRSWHLVPAFNGGQLLSIALFAVVLSLGFLRPRFWCKYVCPSGAVFSIGNLFRVTERKVESSCINCNKCVEICPFDAIKPDFTTRTTDCTMCQSCGGVCPTHAIKFVERWNLVELKVANDPPNHETALGRRGFLSLAAGTAAAVVGGVTVATATKAFGANLNAPGGFLPVRPPGSVPEQEFLEMCIRCGECFKACPNNVLQPEGFQQGLEGLWTPMVNANWAGCESSCNACGQVCPTGAIRALPLVEKKVARMGLAVVNEATCLPFAGVEACDLCVQECVAAGYNAIEYTQVGTELDTNGQPIEGTGYAAPLVIQDKCVGCGLCQTRCYAINVKAKHLLSESAIIVEAGDGKEDRLLTGSYQELRRQEKSDAQNPKPSQSYFVPDTSAPTPSDPVWGPPDTTTPDADPFGIGTPAASPNLGDPDSPF